MASSEDDSMRSSNKGKGRAHPEAVDETTPLLASGSGNHIEDNVPPRRRSLLSKVLSVFLFSLLFFILFLALVFLIAYSYGSRASNISPEEIQRSIRFKGPDRLDVISVGPDGVVSLRVRGRMGLDAGGVVGMKEDENDGILQYVWKSLGRWGIDQLDRVSVNLSPIEVYSQNGHNLLANITISPLELPLTSNPPPDDSWLTETIIPLSVVPTRNVSALAQFMRESWRDGAMYIVTETCRTVVRGGGLNESGWRSRFRTVRTDLQMRMRLKIPLLPGLPPPGSNNPFPEMSTLVTLQSFQIESSHDTLRLFARASAVNPLPDFVVHTSPQFPFRISLPAVNETSTLIPVADVHTKPFNLTHPNISLAIVGTVLPLRENASVAVSELIANYVSLRDTEIVVSSPFYPSLSVSTVFPAKRPKPQILRNVTIRDMKIKPSSSGNSMLASGVIFARAVLPQGIDVGINVTKVLPDVLIFDGEVPTESDEGAAPHYEFAASLPPPQPLPDPLPERAFAHIRPDEWIAASSTPVERDEEDGTSVEVLAHIVDVPLEVLPGRDREFRSFVGKVIFGSQGALAGVQGVAAVAVTVDGLPLDHDGAIGEMELSGLPFQGSVRIGKKGTFRDFETWHV